MEYIHVLFFYNPHERDQMTFRKKVTYRTVIFFFIIILIIGLNLAGVIDRDQVIKTGENIAHFWWAPYLLIIAKIVLYTFALPGSLLIWVAALFYEPVPATVITVVGGVAGGVGAQLFSKKLSSDFTERVKSSVFFKAIKNHSDFATLCAVRTLPNFPHSVINYGAGIINVPIRVFVFSSLIGFTVKGYLYCLAIRRAATADEITDLIHYETIIPLFVLTTLFVAGKILQKMLSNKTK